jgi:hypothetical protein
MADMRAGSAVAQTITQPHLLGRDLGLHAARVAAMACDGCAPQRSSPSSRSAATGAADRAWSQFWSQFTHHRVYWGWVGFNKLHNAINKARQ